MYGKIVKTASIQCKILYQLIQLLTLSSSTDPLCKREDSWVYSPAILDLRGRPGTLQLPLISGDSSFHIHFLYMRRCLSWDKPDLSPGEPCSFLPFPMLIRWTPRHAESILGRNTSMWRMWSWHLEQWEFSASEVLEPGHLDLISSSPI